MGNQKIKLTEKHTRKLPAIDNCEICKKEVNGINRTYFYYSKNQCACHSPHHFDLVHHCDDCIPEIPKVTILHTYRNGKIELEVNASRFKTTKI